MCKKNCQVDHHRLIVPQIRLRPTFDAFQQVKKSSMSTQFHFSKAKIDSTNEIAFTLIVTRSFPAVIALFSNWRIVTTDAIFDAATLPADNARGGKKSKLPSQVFSSTWPHSSRPFWFSRWLPIDSDSSKKRRGWRSKVEKRVSRRFSRKWTLLAAQLYSVQRSCLGRYHKGFLHARNLRGIF